MCLLNCRGIISEKAINTRLDLCLLASDTRQVDKDEKPDVSFQV